MTFPQLANNFPRSSIHQLNSHNHHLGSKHAMIVKCLIKFAKCILGCGLNALCWDNCRHPSGVQQLEFLVQECTPMLYLVFAPSTL